MDKLIITPKTRIYDLLKAYPELEETLIGSAPEFKKLRNPVLRKTITRITNISQAAIIGGTEANRAIVAGPVIPAAADVESGVTYGYAGDEQTGTLAAGGGGGGFVQGSSGRFGVQES